MGSGHLRQNQKPPCGMGKDFMRCGMEKGKENCHSGIRGASQARKGAHGSLLLKRLEIFKHTNGILFFYRRHIKGHLFGQKG